MESLSDTLWDVIICGTGLQQSLLALALSRSGKNVLHIDPNDYYGGPDAVLSLQEAEAWAEQHSGPDNHGVFSSASISKSAGAVGLSFPRAYSLALSPQIIHTRSALLSQLVSSRAYRQVEFLAVGSFFIFRPASVPSPEGSQQQPSLTRIPSTREDVFSASDIPARSKRSLMKFLKFVIDYDGEVQTPIWEPYAEEPLTSFLQKEFNLDMELQTYIMTLTLSLDGAIRTRDGLAAIHRHLSSMGMFGPGFAAVYPKWGGLSEIAQVACRAGAVGGGVYMLGTDIKHPKQGSEGAPEIHLELTSGASVKTRMLVRGNDDTADSAKRISRLIAVIGSPLTSLFEIVVEGAPTPAVAVIACPPRSVHSKGGVASECPVYVLAHSSESGECPAGQSVLYLTTPTTEHSKSILEHSLASVLTALRYEEPPSCLYQMYYEQAKGSGEASFGPSMIVFPTQPPTLSFDDSTLDPIRQAWERVISGTAEDADADYMVFPDRQGVADDDDLYD